jgi:hypothetical protein
MMAAEGPFLAAVIARLADPKFNLAAYGVAYSFAVLLEAPIIMIMSAATALVHDRDSFLKLRNYTYALNAAITGLMLVFLIPPVFHQITGELIGLPPGLERLTFTSVWLLLPWPAAIGFRRFYQGILIRSNLTRRVAYGTVVRLTSMVAIAVAGAFLTSLPGAAVGGLALSAGVTAEALACRLMAAGAMRKLHAVTCPPEKRRPLTYRSITRFYYPLALTSILSLGIHPMTTFFLGHSRMPLESLAVLPVVNSLVFIFRSMGLSFQEVVIALLNGNWKAYPRLRDFAILLGVAVTAGLAVVAFTPVSALWFSSVSGLTPELSRFAVTPTRILVLIPAMTVLLAFQRALMVISDHTSPVTIATAIEVMGIFGLLAVTIHAFGMVGAVGAATAIISGRVLSNSYLLTRVAPLLRERLPSRDS